MSSSRFSKAIEKFDEYNAADPNGKEVLYAQRMSERLRTFEPNAAEHVALAIHCQHIGRWTIPRNSFPEGKKGYIAWRNKLKTFHAETAGRILKDVGYDDETVAKVKDLLEKKDLRKNTDTQLLEDVVCIVFVEFYLDEFAAKHDDDKVIDILAKTLKKMSPRAIEIASSLTLNSRIKQLLLRSAANG